MQRIPVHSQLTDGLVLLAYMSLYVTEATKGERGTAVIGYAPTRRARDEIAVRMGRDYWIDEAQALIPKRANT